MAVDVGHNTYSFGRYFECRQQAVLMSGFLGSAAAKSNNRSICSMSLALQKEQDPGRDLETGKRHQFLYDSKMLQLFQTLITA